MVPIVFSVNGLPFTVEKGKLEEPELPQTQEEFEEILRRAEAGDVRAQYLAGCVYRAQAEEKRAYLSENVPSGSPNLRAPFGLYDRDIFSELSADDFRAAFSWFERAASQGDPEALYALSECYTQGMGTAVYPEKGRALLLEAAEKGCAFAQYDVARAYYYGVKSQNGVLLVPQDYSEAVVWFQRAAAQGDALGLYFLARCLEEGTGIGRNEPEAVPLYRLSADLGNPWAQCALGRCLENGIGTEQDLGSAIAYYRLAADGGDAEAWDALERLGVE